MLEGLDEWKRSHEPITWGPGAPGQAPRWSDHNTGRELSLRDGEDTGAGSSANQRPVWLGDWPIRGQHCRLKMLMYRPCLRDAAADAALRCARPRADSLQIIIAFSFYAWAINNISSMHKRFEVIRAAVELRSNLLGCMLQHSNQNNMIKGDNATLLKLLF